MAAVLPHLEQQGVGREWSSGSRLAGFGEARRFTGPPPDALARHHAELTQLGYVRETVFDRLSEISYEVCAGDREGRDTRNVYLVLSEPIGTAPLWNPPGDGKASQFKLLSWTSKMGCPSFSLPAGAPQLGGSCPGAVAGQSTVPLEARRAGARRVLEVVREEVDLQRAICETCYAAGGRYATSLVQYAQALNFAWATQAVRDGSFVEIMAYAVDHADYLLGGGERQGNAYLREGTGERFFRIHDSGDFFDVRYLEAWRAVADELPDVTFWAPTRIWATGWGVDAVNRINDPERHPPNLIIRPSAYMVGSDPPRYLGPGWAQGTVVAPKDEPVGRASSAARIGCLTEPVHAGTRSPPTAALAAGPVGRTGTTSRSCTGSTEVNMRARPIKRRLDRCAASGCRLRGRPALKVSRLEGHPYTSGRGTRPCRVESRRCPVQLVFIGGRTFLRTCAERGVVDADTEIASGREGQRFARAWCSRYKKG